VTGRLVDRLLDHAATVLPPGQRQWAEAMRAELGHVPPGLETAEFVLGCLWTAYLKRIEDMLTLACVTRWILSALALVWAGLFFLGTLLFTRVKTTPGLTPADLGSDPGTDQNLRFILAYPAWEIALMAFIGTTLAFGAVLLFRRRPNALPLLGLGAAAATWLGFLDLRLVDAGQDWILAWTPIDLIPLLCLVPVWWLSRRAPDLKTA
jgi:hypothetical protein